MTDSTPHITAAELRIMKVLWDIGSGTVRHVLEALPDDGGDPPAYTTVMTMMKQLAEKGALAVDRTRQPFVYTPAVRKERVLSQRLSQFLQTVFDGQAGDLVLHLVEDTDLSPEDLRRIETKIRAREHEDRGVPRRREQEEGQP
ncbi:MAG: BlaI/MecI/CopY family transcriptional regulator [Planctomycetes bacterium]|nr:BlaI/MecI/CopY family transcriptional regulator [Planctomycetota bacterium]